MNDHLMAEKRMISRAISISKKFNLELKDDHLSRLLYLLLLPYTDDFGRLTGDPYKLKALVLPMMHDVSDQDIERSLNKLNRTKLIIWYEADGERYIQINNFDDHQSGLHKRTKSKFPEPPGNSGKFPENDGNSGNTTESPGNSTERTEGTERNLKSFNSLKSTTTTTSAPEILLDSEGRTGEPITSSSSEPDPNHPPDIQPENYYNAHKRIFGFNCNEFQSDDLKQYIEVDGFEEACVIYAMERAALGMTSYKFRLITTILNDYDRAKAKTKAAAMALDVEYDKRKQLQTAGRSGSGPPRGSGKPKLEVVKDDPSRTRKLTPEEAEKALELARRLRDG